MSDTPKPFLPPRRILMGPGPSDVSQPVLQAMSRPTIGHLDPEFVRMMDEIKRLLQYAFRTRNELTMPVSAPGSAGMEATFVNLVEPGDEVVVCINGVFGARMRENVERCGGRAITLEQEWGEPIDPQRLDDTLQRHPDARIVAFIHAETSTGVLSDAAALAEVARRHDCLTLVDAVTSLAGSPLQVDAWGIDAIYSGSQKCLSGPPGLSPVSFSARAQERIRSRRTPVQSWFLDKNLVMGYWGAGTQRAYHHTAPVNNLYGLHEALRQLHGEGLESAWARHKAHHEALKAGLEAMGIEFLVEAPYRLPQLNTIRIPDGVDDAEVRRRLLSGFDLEIGAGLGALAGKVWRIGLMGHTARRENVELCLTALDRVLGELGAPVALGVAVDAARASYDAMEQRLAS